ncbi:amidohydrolase 3, putative [Babesia ovata]|uniref:Amidohydrolase 3, putative n=1 Tax=Babesia ovata TaxID=189622 RepID=A0A2H6K7T6_9APIC|nr:amidohydrolase 3, putative [Babesia ovata]GBE59063.1 amidohydrolase 3, putative [Babesia ovata]
MIRTDFCAAGKFTDHGDDKVEPVDVHHLRWVTCDSVPTNRENGQEAYAQQPSGHCEHVLHCVLVGLGGADVEEQRPHYVGAEHHQSADEVRGSVKQENGSGDEIRDKP